MSLKHVKQYLNNIEQYSGRLDKEELISEYVNDSLFRQVVLYTLDPYKQYNVSQLTYTSNIDDENIKKYQQDVQNIFKMLDFLSQKNGATNDEKMWLSMCSSIDSETFEVVKRIVNKDLRCGASIKTFQKFIPEIPTFGCMLCKKDLPKFFKHCKNNTSNMCWSIKLDGVRCVAHPGQYLSRNGKEFPNFKKFDDQLQLLVDLTKQHFPKFNNHTIVFDGEVIVKGFDTKSFQQLMTQISRINEVDSNFFEYQIFDIVLDDVPFYTRFTILRKIFEEFNKLITDDVIIKLVEHYDCSQYSNEEDIKELTNYMCDQNYEGVILKDINSPYERKYSKYWCKVKKVETLDLEVIDWKYGTGKYKNVLGALVCKLKNGKTVSVGSGFSDEDRTRFMYNLPQIIEVEYQEQTDDGNLRFPIFKRIRDDKNETD